MDFDMVHVSPLKKTTGFWVFLRPWGKIHFEFRHGTRFATRENDGALWIFRRRNRLFSLAPSEENARLNCGAARISLKKIPETIASVSAKPSLALFFSAVWEKCAPELRHGTHYATRKAAAHLFFFSAATPSLGFCLAPSRLRTGAHPDARNAAENLGVFPFGETAPGFL